MSRGEDQQDDGLGRAWIGVGVPILGLMFVVIMLAIAALAWNAREQDRAYAQASVRLMQGSTDGRAQLLTATALDYALWDSAYQNITESWNGDWVEANFYTTIADGMIIVSAEGVVRYRWFSEEYAAQTSEAQTAAVIAARQIPNVRRLLTAASAEDAVSRTMTVLDDRLVIVAVAAIAPENGAASTLLGRAADYLIVVDIVEPEKLSEVGAALDLGSLRFVANTGAVGEDEIQLPLTDARDLGIGALQWRHARPGRAAFSRQIWPIILGLMCIGAIAIFIARMLVTRQMRIISGARAAEQASQAKSDFLTRVSHELRTPLNAVIGYAEMIEEDRASPESRGDARRIIEAARHLGHLINDIIDQSRLDSGRVRLVAEVLPVAGVLAEVQGLIAQQAKKAGVRLTVSSSPHADFAFADLVRIRQCLLNLIGNAIKFSPEGSQVSVSARRMETPNGPMIVFDVIDQGIGIAKSEIDAIFRPFGQANSSIGKSFGGSGLGLSIARDLAREMAGDITVVSEPGKGSTFSLRIPAATGRALKVVA
ncbi:MAG: hypothetical protein K2X34_04965 [Hyphomonadaceae bacterium]|nr:hypothetical protein [Hyphomonadaceae bacterium]